MSSSQSHRNRRTRGLFLTSVPSGTCEIETMGVVIAYGTGGTCGIHGNNGICGTHPITRPDKALRLLEPWMEPT